MFVRNGIREYQNGIREYQNGIREYQKGGSAKITAVNKNLSGLVQLTYKTFLKMH